MTEQGHAPPPVADLKLRIAAVAGFLGLWAGTSWLFWTGYVGSDDMFYTRYAHSFDRFPYCYWEFRMPFILAVRASFGIFGTSEFAAALPNLAVSLVLMASIAWIIGWPNELSWRTNSTMILSALFPLEANLRTLPAATYMGSMLTGAGVACWIRGGPAMRYVGSAVLALAFATHELMLFPVGISAAVALLFNWKRFSKPVLILGCLAAASVAAEAVVYGHYLGNPMARFSLAAGGAATSVPGADITDSGVSGPRFYWWPIEVSAVSKQFAGSLMLLFVASPFAWRKFSREQKMLFVMLAATWIWFGWGTMVPWDYKPFFRQFHHWTWTTLGVNVLMPAAVLLAFGRNTARCVLVAMAGIYFLALASGGRWGQTVESARVLLAYADARPTRTFLTDVHTMNEMYLVNGFRLPRNVFCRNGDAVSRHLLINKGPVGTPVFSFNEVEPDAILLNTEGDSQIPFEAEFAAYVKQHPGQRDVVMPMKRKWLLAHIPVLRDHPAAVRSLGAQVIRLTR